MRAGMPEVENHLTAHLVGETLLDECPRCGDLWIDRPAFDRVVQARERRPKLLAVDVESSPLDRGSAGRIRHRRSPR